jgi:hypothetical protein
MNTFRQTNLFDVNPISDRFLYTTSILSNNPGNLIRFARVPRQYRRHFRLYLLQFLRIHTTAHVPKEGSDMPQETPARWRPRYFQTSGARRSWFTRRRVAGVARMACRSCISPRIPLQGFLKVTGLNLLETGASEGADSTSPSTGDVADR